FTFAPDRLAHVWTAPDRPSYTVQLHNTTAEKQVVTLDLSATSHDGSSGASAGSIVRLDAGPKQAGRLPPLGLKRYGYHPVRLSVRDGQGTRTRTRSLAHLRSDTRARGGWEEGRGPIFGFWDWNGGHETPGGLDRLRVMAAAGAESKMSSFYTK